MRRNGWLLLLTAALAVILTTVLYAGLLRDAQTLRELNARLEESRASWESTAEAKEKLQAELKTAEEALKEAKLTISESATRAETLKADIAELRAELGETEEETEAPAASAP